MRRRTLVALSMVAALVGGVLVAPGFAKEPRRVRVTLGDRSAVEGTLESVKDGVYSIRVGTTLIALEESDVKKIEFLGAEKPAAKPPEKPVEKPAEKPPEPAPAAKAPDTKRIHDLPGPFGKNIAAGLGWLARHQHPDGHWGTTDYAKNCTGPGCTGEGIADFDVGATGLATLALLAGGQAPGGEGALADASGRALDFLVGAQHEDGAVGPPCSEEMYNHAIATLALARAYGITKDGKYREPAAAAVRYLLDARNAGLGWRYSPRSGNNDTSITGWCVRALVAARSAGLEVDDAPFQGARRWLDRVTDKDGQTGYDRLGSGEIYVPGKNEAWRHHQTMTAVALEARVAMTGDRDDPVDAKAAKILVRDLPLWDTRARDVPMDFYYWFHGTSALALYEAPKGPRWKKWRRAVVAAIAEHQNLGEDCKGGSWDTEEIDRWAYAGGRVYGTAVNLLTLEVVNDVARAAGPADASDASVPGAGRMPLNPFAKARPGDELVFVARLEPASADVDSITFAAQKSRPVRYVVEAGRSDDTVKVVATVSTMDVRGKLERKDAHEFSTKNAPTFQELADFFVGAGTLETVSVEEATVAGAGGSFEGVRVRFETTGARTGFKKGSFTISAELPAPGLLDVELTDPTEDTWKTSRGELHGFKRAGAAPTGETYDDLRKAWYETVPAEYKKDGMRRISGG